jgi:calcineurin-like phosphoesterase family protein
MYGLFFLSSTLRTVKANSFLTPSMKHWFTSDTHFGHANIIKYCNRPFKSLEEMDKTIINNWNKVVSAGDIVYHLGDFCFGREDSTFDFYLRRLNGLIIFIKGNHDKLAWRNRRHFYRAYDSYFEEEVNEQSITLCHYSMNVWNKSHYGAWHLYGHSHGTLPDNPHSLSFDCGVDCTEFTPLSFEQVKEKMAKKLWRPIDHHVNRKEGGGVGLNREDYTREVRRTLYKQLKQEFEQPKCT